MAKHRSDNLSHVPGIPQRFELLGHTIEVVYRDDLDEDEGALGLSEFHKNRITLQTPSEDYHVDAIRQTYWHELTHFILFVMGETRLNGNEKFVDLFGQCLFQHDRTKVYFRRAAAPE